MSLVCTLHAERGSGRDYTVTNTGGTITSESTDAATVIIRVDGVALERNETFQLKLEVESPPTGDVFCIDILDVVIQDSDGKGSKRENRAVIF